MAMRRKKTGPKPKPGKMLERVGVPVTQRQKEKLFLAADFAERSFADWARRVLLAAAEKETTK